MGTVEEKITSTQPTATAGDKVSLLSIIRGLVGSEVIQEYGVLHMAQPNSIAYSTANVG
jgi:hypothetical protein